MKTFHIGLISFGTLGDVRPFILLAQALQNRGHRAVLFTNRLYEDECLKAGIEARFLDNTEQSDAMLKDLWHLDHPEHIRSFFSCHVLPRLQNAIDILIEEQKFFSFDHIVAMGFFGLGNKIAEAIKSGLTTLFLSPHHLFKWEASLHFSSLYFPDSIGKQLSITKGQTIRTRSSELTEFDGVALWPLWFENGHHAFAISRTGFPVQSAIDYEELPPPVRIMLQDGVAPILVTGSTGGDQSAHAFFETALSACERAGRRVIVILPETKPLAYQLPPSWIRLTKIPNLRALMTSSAAVIHHGGIGTVADAFAAGTPQLILASSLDRPTNGRLVEAAGAGICLPLSTATKGDIVEALDVVIKSPGIRSQCLKLRDHVLQNRTSETICAHIEDAIWGRIASARIL